MINEDVLRRAVELAPGWADEGNRISINGCVLYTDWEHEPWLLDALAAALVRLVDGLDGEIDVQVFSGLILIGEPTNCCGVWPELGKAEGPDRTENTINCIVEFDKQNPGVLSKREASDE